MQMITATTTKTTVQVAWTDTALSLGVSFPSGMQLYSAVQHLRPLLICAEPRWSINVRSRDTDQTRSSDRSHHQPIHESNQTLAKLAAHEATAVGDGVALGVSSLEEAND